MENKPLIKTIQARMIINQLEEDVKNANILKESYINLEDKYFKLQQELSQTKKENESNKSKLDKIEEYLQDRKAMTYFKGAFSYGEFVNNVLDIIKED